MQDKKLVAVRGGGAHRAEGGWPAGVGRVGAGIPELGSVLQGQSEVGTRWGVQGVVLGVPVVEWVRPVGPVGSVSRPSSPRAD